MNLSESFLTALDALLANKLRAVLTMLGVIIGVAAVIALVSIGNGLDAFITGEIQSIGSNLLFVTTDSENSGGYPALSLDDVEALSDPFNAPALAAVSAEIGGQQEVIAYGINERTAVNGVTYNYFDVNNYVVELGNGFLQSDLDTRARVAVIGPEIAETLFGDTFPIGESVKIGGVSYEVIGVTEAKGESVGSNPDTTIFVPLSTAQSRLYPRRTRTGERAINLITAQAVSENQTDAAIEQITETLRDQHGIIYASDDDFTIISQTALLESFSAITATLTLFLGAVAGISLVVGGIGIMNIMLVSVTERTREIGIRKAIGALRRDILLQFLIESVLLSLIGGVIGIVLGASAAFALSNFLGELVPTVDLGTIVMATSFATAVGVIFGLYPAWRASNLRPIEALRYE
ncbi:MAG: ABC transporter permease [Anaerolineae bacterium]|nr:ABC transporter permease [Anaerolineae bacterium]MCO5204209.1 ABC transporter permease [Anaerolineae bacterium]